MLRQKFKLVNKLRKHYGKEADINKIKTELLQSPPKKARQMELPPPKVILNFIIF